MSEQRLLTAAPPALLALGAWRAPIQELLPPRHAFADATPPDVPDVVPVETKKIARRVTAARRAVVQIALRLEPYSMAEWLRLPQLRDLPPEPARAPLAERRRVRKRSLPHRRRLTQDERREKVRIHLEGLPVLPTVRRQCQGVPRPCPFVSCRHHNYLDVNLETGTITLNFPEIEPWEMEPAKSCSLDVANGGQDPYEPLEVIPLARILNRTPQLVHGLLAHADAEYRAKLEAFRVDANGDDP